MNYITTVEAAKKWNITANRVFKLAREGRIPGVVQIASRWMIPETAVKPTDARVKNASKVTAGASDFRFPAFEHTDIALHTPPLTDGELRYKAASEAFHACRFEEADRLLGDLPETAGNKYLRIFSLHAGCSNDIFLCNAKRFFERYNALQAELRGDFPYKTEVQSLLYELDATLGLGDNPATGFRIQVGYRYHDSYLTHLASMSAVSLLYANGTTLAEIQTHEVNCIFLERADALVDLQALHLYLGNAYAFLKMSEEMTYHYRAALSIAEKYGMYYLPASLYYYMQKAFVPALSHFSEEFERRLSLACDEIHTRYLKFTETVSVNSIYCLLTRNDYIFAFMAIMGYTNKEIADFLRVSVSTVGKRFGQIYSSLGVSGKSELIAMYHKLRKTSVLPGEP